MIRYILFPIEDISREEKFDITRKYTNDDILFRDPYNFNDPETFTLNYNKLLTFMFKRYLSLINQIKNGAIELNDVWIDTETLIEYRKGYDIRNTIIGIDKFKVISQSIMEIFIRDYDATHGYSMNDVTELSLLPYRFNMLFEEQLYVVLVLYTNPYENGLQFGGSIYCWGSDESSPYFYSMGIKARIDNSLIGENEKLKYASRYILEGARLLAIEQGKTIHVIPTPTGNMIPILESYGFVRGEVKPYNSGLAEYLQECIECFIRPIDISFLN